MRGNAACWMDCLEVQGDVLKIFTDFKHMFIDQYTPLDYKNVTRDKLRELQKCGTVQEYIT